MTFKEGQKNVSFNALLLKIISLECLAYELKCFSNEAHKIQAYLFLTK